MDKERLAQLIADYREGKITAEEFNARRDDINGDGSPQSERPVMNAPGRPPMPTNTKILIGIGGGIFLMLCIIAFLMFWNSPEQVAKRALPGLLKAQEEAQQEMETELAAQKDQREKAAEFDARNEAKAIFEDMAVAFLGAKEFVAQKTRWSHLKEIPTIWDVIESINDINNDINNKSEKSDLSIKRLDRISINGETNYTNGYFIRIRYDLSDVGSRSKEKLLDFKGVFADVGFFLSNKDGYPFDGRGDAVYCVIRGKP